MASEKDGGSVRQLRVPAVQLRVVGESLEILQEFGSKLELTSTVEGRACRVFFRDGNYQCGMYIICTGCHRTRMNLIL